VSIQEHDALWLAYVDQKIAELDAAHDDDRLAVAREWRKQLAAIFDNDSHGGVC
jgi:hypothetical protein